MKRPAAMRGFRCLAVLLAGLLVQSGSGGLRAQELLLGATADTTAIRIGEQVRVTLSATLPPGIVIRNVGPSDSLGALEIVAIDSGAAAPGAGGNAGGAPFRRVYTVTAFDTGTHVLPPFIAYYSAGSGAALRSALSGPIVLTVRGVDVDTSAEIRAIKPPLGAPLTLAEVLPYLGGVAAAALLSWLVYYILKKRKRGETFIPAPPPRPADEVALEALRAIASEKLWQRGMVKEYHTALSDVVRTYIERRFSVLAMESTSDEILSSAPVAALGAGPVAALEEVLLRSDLVKFAKMIPPPEENERSLSRSVSFVELTRGTAPPQPAVPAAAVNPDAAGAGGAGSGRDGG